MEKLDHLGWVVCQSYEISGSRFQIRSTSRAFGSWLHDVLAMYRVTGEAEPLYSVVVPGEVHESRLGSAYSILYRGSRVVARSLQTRTIGRALLAELESLLFAGRGDAAYLEAVLLRSNGKLAVVPGVLGPILDGLGRRVSRAGITLPVTGFVSVDLDTGLLKPLAPLLEVPEDALARITNHALTARAGNGSDLAFVEEATKVDVACSIGASELIEPQPTSRGQVLHSMAFRILNLRELQGRALEAMAKLLARAQCYELGRVRAARMLEGLSSVLGFDGPEAG